MELSYSDRAHAYWLDGDRCKGVTTVAKIPDDTYNLTQWGKRMVALGMAKDDSLAERALAHFDDKSALNDVAEDALRAAKAHQSAARGTAIHRILERHDLGEELIDTPHSRAMRAAYDKALAGAGLEVVPEYIERIVVHPKQKIAGRFDRLFRRRRDGKYVIGDIKSGSGAVDYPHSTSIQLAMYANADLMAGPIPSYGGKTQEFTPLPEKLDKKWGYIIHAPDADHLEVVQIDIAKGWKIAQQAIFPILAWRADKELLKPLGTTSISELEERASEERVKWILGRLSLLTMVDHVEGVKEIVARRWPAEIARPKQLAANGGDATWTEFDVDALDTMLAGVEKDCVTPFPVKDPALAEIEAA